MGGHAVASSKVWRSLRPLQPSRHAALELHFTPATQSFPFSIRWHCRDLFLGKGRPVEEARQMMAQVLLALHTLHSNRHVHRDIKPENTLAWSNWPDKPVPVHMEPWTKVCDLGMLRVDDEDYKTMAVGSDD